MHDFCHCIHSEKEKLFFLQTLVHIWLNGTAIRQHDKCIRISPLNCRKKEFSFRRLTSERMKNVCRRTHSHTHIFLSRRCSKEMKIRNDEAWFFFLLKISFRLLFIPSENFDFFNLHVDCPRTHFESTFYGEILLMVCGFKHSTDFTRLSLSATQQEIKNSFCYRSGELSLPKSDCLHGAWRRGGWQCTGEIST